MLYAVFFIYMDLIESEIKISSSSLSSIAPSVKAVKMAFHCRFGKLSSAFALWRLVSILMCFCRVEQCSQSQTYLLISWTQQPIRGV